MNETNSLPARVEFTDSYGVTFGLLIRNRHNIAVHDLLDGSKVKQFVANAVRREYLNAKDAGRI